MNIFIKIILITIIFSFNIVKAEIITVENSYKNQNKNNEPTTTKYYKGTNSKLLIVFIAGGEGMFRFGPQKTEPTLSYYTNLKKITDKNFTSGNYDLVLFDSPYSLGEGIFNQIRIQRGSIDHLNRIEDIINFYKEKTKLPIILMGHSNGGISVMEFTDYILKNNSKHNLISGIIMSGARDEANRFLKSANIPIIFLHHKRDNCSGTTYDGALSAYEKMKKDKISVSLITIETGGPEGNLNPCYSGTHMYYGSDNEVPIKLDEELKKIYFKN